MKLLEIRTARCLPRRARSIARAAAALTVVAGFAAPGSVRADTVAFPPGFACPFALTLDIEGAPQVSREFYDRNGNLVRTLLAGTGAQLTFRNEENGATLALRANGSVIQVRPNADGTSRYMATGHTVLIMFPTDVPAGPTTTLYAGRVVFDADASSNFTLRSTTGTSTDLCRALL